MALGAGTAFAADLKVGDKCKTSKGTDGTVKTKYSEKGEAVGLTCVENTKAISQKPILSADKKTQPQGNESVKPRTIFDRWGNLKTKKGCETEGGVWDGGTGQGDCTGPLKGSQK